VHCRSMEYIGIFVSNMQREKAGEIGAVPWYRTSTDEWQRDIP
jgi:hypothetical protein